MWVLWRMVCSWVSLLYIMVRFCWRYVFVGGDVKREWFCYLFFVYGRMIDVFFGFDCDVCVCLCFKV